MKVWFSVGKVSLPSRSRTKGHLTNELVGRSKHKWNVALLGRIRVVCFSIDRDEVGKAVIEGVPEVANALRLGARHPESVLVSGVVPELC
jgi:hypothetical protein